MKSALRLLCVALLFGTLAEKSPASGFQQALARRCQSSFEIYARAPIPHPNYPKDAMPLHTARLVSGAVERVTVLADVDRMMEAAMRDKLDPFHLHAILHGERVGGDLWPESLREKFRAYVGRWSFTKPAGVSLNHELMRDGAGLLATEIWPDLVDADGNSAEKIRDLCSKRLLERLEAIPREGDPEYNAPLYHGTDFMALRMLVDFSPDSEIRDTARGALEWLLVDTGAHWHRGYAFSSAGRSKYWGSSQVSPQDPGTTTVMAWMIFGGDIDANVANVPQGFWMAYPSAWQESLGWLPRWQASLPVPRMVRASIAVRSHGYKVRKESWITNGYGLSSQRTDETSPESYLFKECRNVLLRWIAPEPASSFIVFQENRRRPREKIANAFAYGENPYAQTMQHEGTILGIHNVPDDYGFQRVIAPFTKRGAIRARIERDGWIFANGGTVLFAFRFLEPGFWLPPDTKQNLDLFASDTPKGGWILETSPAESFSGETAEVQLERFAEAVLSKTRSEFQSEKLPLRLRFTNLRGRRLEIVWKTPGTPYRGECKVDGKAIDYSKWPRLEAPGMRFSKEGWPMPAQTLFRSSTVGSRAFPADGLR